MKLAIDIDGVLRDFVGALVQQYRKDFGCQAPEINQWELAQFFPIGRDIYRYYNYVRPREIFFDALPYPGAVEFMETLNNPIHLDGGGGRFEVTLITNQIPQNYGLTCDWLFRHRIPFDSLVFTARKELFYYDILLDDSTHNLNAAKEAGRRAICFNQPYNEKDWEGERVFTYGEFLRRIKR